jgi:hypothetical protein
MPVVEIKRRKEEGKFSDKIQESKGKLGNMRRESMHYRSSWVMLMP